MPTLRANRMKRSRAAASLAATVALGAIGLTGCGTAELSSCATSGTAPTTLSGDDRRDPQIASDGGGGIVAVWESVTGGPIEASTRDAAGTWAPTRPLSARFARDPAIAVDPSGVAVAAWQLPKAEATTSVQVTSYSRERGWSEVSDVSPAGAHAREPQVAVTGAGTVVLVWRRDAPGPTQTVLEVVERRPDGQWDRPRTLSDPTARATRPRLAMSPTGSAALVWEQKADGRNTVMAATRTPDGLWSQAESLSTPTSRDQEPDVAIDARGNASAVWIGETDAGASVFAASHPDRGSWSSPTVIGRGSAVPHETPRPGRADTGADIALLPDSRAVAVWTIVDGDTNRAQSAATDPSGTWLPANSLSAPGVVASGVQVASLAGGSAIAGWEELDGGLLRARVARLDGQGRPAACTDLTGEPTDSGAVRVVGGSAPSAVFVDFNRSRVQVAELR